MADFSTSAVQEAVDALCKAMIARNRTALDMLTADELVYGHIGGRVETKSQFIENVLDPGKTGFAEIVTSDQRVVLLENAAIVWGIARRRRLDQPLGSGTRMRELAVWIIQSEKWKLVARQTVQL